MKKLQLKKPDIKGKIRKIKNLKKEDVIAYWKGRHERRERILEARRNSAFAKKMQPVYAFTVSYTHLKLRIQIRS